MLKPKQKMRLGDLLVENGIITEEQLKLALAYQNKTGQKLGQALVSLKFVSDQKLQEFLSQQRKKVRIGDLLVSHKLISDEQLKRALTEQKVSGKKLGQCIVSLGFLTENAFLEFMAAQMGMPFVDLRTFQFKNEVVQLIPESAARRFRTVALNEGKDGLLVGMADPNDIFVYDELSRTLQRPPRLALVSEGELLKSLDRIYRRTEEIASHAEELGEEMSRSQFDLDQIVQAEMAVDAPVVRVLRSLFEDAVQMGASDIHIEPDETVLRIRQRIDGVLQEQVVKEKQIAPALVSKLKLMAGLEISEKRLPQDGRFAMTVKDKKVDVRMSTLPIQDGESVVLRLLDQSGDNLKLERVGMEPRILERFKQLIHRPHGLVLVTGPTGSGKTTTLYGALNELNLPSKKIITVEDPVEYRLPRINQVGVRPKIGLTFARVLRTVLRQDPDVVLVGEMRDKETADIAIRAALTGHLVLSTLHTNDAISTAIRLVEMGAEGFAVAAALQCILAQRLVRRVCADCKTPYLPDDKEKLLIRQMVGPTLAPRIRLVHGAGCHNCNNTGYAGRIAVVELLEMRADLADALRREDTAAFVATARKQKGYRPLHLAALAYAVRGVTSLEEVLRLTSDLGDEETPLEAPPEEEAPVSAEEQERQKKEAAQRAAARVESLAGQGGKG